MEATEQASGTDAHPGARRESETAAVLEQLGRILRSPAFVRAPRMQRFLEFLIGETLAGRAGQLKEYTIAVGVFGKPVDFDPGTNPIVRVEAGRLRKMLAQYRVEHGAGDRVAIEVPKGTYVPIFCRARPSELPSATATEPPAATSTGLTRADWAPSEERRRVTVLSCAFGDERGVPQSGLAGDYLHAYDLFHERCTSIARQHGGTLDAGASDRLIVYFGWPNALEDAAGRALTAALEILGAVQQAFGAAALGVRIGIASSEVIARGGASSAAPAVIGEAPALATQILQKVPLNGVLVAESTRRLTGAAFEMIPAGSLDDPGDERNLLWRLLRARPTLTRFRAAHSASPSAIIGRREELALAKSRWRLSRQGEGHGVLILGEAGIGKSRVAESLLEEIQPEGSVMRAQCSPHHANSTLYPFIELVKSQIGPLAEDEAALDRQLEAFLAPLGIDQPVDRAVLRMLLLGGGELLEGLSASQQKDLTLKLLLRMLSAQARRNPTALLLEDLHWADPTSVELLQDLLRLAASTQLLVLMTSRENLPASCAPATNVTSIRLARLPRKDSGELVDRLLDAAPLAPEARSHILAKAEGIPLFLEELTKLFLAADNGRQQGPQIPQSLSDLLASQLDRLGPTRSIAQVAAVIGRQFSREMLALVSGNAAEHVEAGLDRLLAAGVIVREGEGSKLFAFRHALLRDAAYGSMLERACKEWHYRVGSVLADSFPDQAAEHPEVVARHMTEAGRHDEAVPFWVSAGRKASSRYALAEAITDFRLALAALQVPPRSSQNRERELEVLIDLGFVIRHAHGYGDPELAAIYQRARTLATELGRQESLANAVYGLWTHAAGRGAWTTAVTLANEFEVLARQMQDDDQIQVEASRLLGASAALRGEFPIARVHFERALAAYDSARHGPRFGFDPGAASAAYMAWTLWHLGEREEAGRHEARALAIAESKNHAASLAMVLSWLMFYEVCADDPAAVIDYNRRLQAVCAERDCRYWQPFGSACAEWAEFQRDGDAARLDRLLDFTHRFRERYFTSCLLLLGAGMCGELRLAERGLELVSAAQQFIEEHDERVWEAESHRVAAELLLSQAKPDLRRVRRLLQTASGIARRQQARALAERVESSLTAVQTPARSGGTRSALSTQDRLH